MPDTELPASRAGLPGGAAELARQWREDAKSEKNPICKSSSGHYHSPRGATDC